MTFSAAMLAEFSKAGGEFYKRLRIAFPAETELVTLIPDATTLEDVNHLITGALTVHEALDDPVATPDDSTSRLAANLADTRAESRVSFPALPDWVKTVQELRVYCRGANNQSGGQEDQDGSWTFAVRIGSTNYEGAIANSRFFNPDFRTMVLAFPLSPATGELWTVAEVNAVEVAVVTAPDALGVQGGQRITQAYIQLDAERTQIGRYSDVAINSRADGLYVAKVLGWTSPTYSVAGTSNAIQRPTAGARVADQDEELSQRFAGSGIDEIRRATVTIEYVSPNVARTSDTQDRVFTGLLHNWTEVVPHEWDLQFVLDDSSLEGAIPKAKISEQDYPDADPKNYDKQIQVIYGLHDSLSGGTVDGMIPCPNVDKVLFRRLVASHHVVKVRVVYSKGNKEDPAKVRIRGTAAGNALTAEYQIITPIVGGRQQTILEFNLTGQTQEEKDKFNELTISADVEGIETVGDGSGFLINNPADIWKHAFVNWIANDYFAGLWFPDTAAPVDVDLFDECAAFFALVRQSASRFLGGVSNAKKGRDELNGWAKDLNMRVFWTEAGLLGALPHTPFDLNIYIDEPWFQQGLHDIEDPQYVNDTSDLHDRILLSYFHQANGNAFLANTEIRDSEIGESKVDTVKSFWLPSGIPIEEREE